MTPYAFAMAGLMLAASVALAADGDWRKVDEVIGKKGQALPGGVHKYGFPRSDLNVSVDGVQIKPTFALGSWVAFASIADGAMLMGDLVLTDAEISPVMKRLIDGGFDVTAIHNHLIRTSIPVLYLHIGAHGDPTKLAQTLHMALALSNTPLTAPATLAPPPLDLDTTQIEKLIGFKGNPNGGVLQFAVPRTEPIFEQGMAIPPAMGTAITINFQPTGGGTAAITGDFVLTGSEVNPVLKSLREQGIEVTALHSHMLDESPRLFFMHFWAHGDALTLAQSLRTALERVNVKRRP